MLKQVINRSISSVWVLILVLFAGLMSLTITSTLTAKEYRDVWLLPTVSGTPSKIEPVVKDLIAGNLREITNDQVCGGGGGQV